MASNEEVDQLGELSLGGDMTEAENTRRAKIRYSRKSSVSAECFKDTAHEAQKPLKNVPKSEDARQRIKLAISENILFQALDAQSTSDVVNAMEEVKVASGEVVIKEGDPGDNFYVVEQGTADVFLKRVDNGERPILSYKRGDGFGELALMYNCPRAATVRATSDMTLWSLDRVSFRRLLITNLVSKRQRYEAFLDSVAILSSMDKYERSVVADCLIEESAADGTAIVKQGDSGDLADKFYIIVDGECRATITKDGKEAEVKRIKAGEYFGEIALLQSVPRKATVYAVGPVRLLALDRKAFNRMLGPVEGIIKRNVEQYKSYEQALAEQTSDI